MGAIKRMTDENPNITFAEACDLFDIWLRVKYPDGDYDLLSAIDEYANEGPGSGIDRPKVCPGIVPRRVHP